MYVRLRPYHIAAYYGRPCPQHSTRTSIAGAHEELGHSRHLPRECLLKAIPWVVGGVASIAFALWLIERHSD